MALFLAVHTPREGDDESGRVHKPTNLHDLALEHGGPGMHPRWLKVWSPDLNDDRMFTLWEADSAESIEKVLQNYGFLDDFEMKAFTVLEWGPEQVLESRQG
jgi:hypothetical protein